MKQSFRTFVAGAVLVGLLGGGVASTEAHPAPLFGIGSLHVKVHVTPSQISYGTKTIVEATTSTGASCTIKVAYPSGTTSTSKALAGAKMATAGKVSWTWKVGTHKSGTATATVTCTKGSHTATGMAHFTIG